MSQQAPSAKAIQYPWLRALVAHPEEEVRSFLSGYAKISPFSVESLREAACSLLQPFGEGTPERVAFDTGLCAWLGTARGGRSAQKGEARIAFEASNALAIAAALGLAQTALSLRNNFEDFYMWSEHLSAATKFDVRAEFLAAIALTQRLEAVLRSSAEHSRLEPLWYKLCERAGSYYPRSYLSLGFLGLRLLPERSAVPNERPWLLGLARWGATQRPSAEEFLREWRALKALYPRTKAHWRSQIRYILQDRSIEHLATDLREAWGHDVGLTAEAASNVPPDPVWRAMSSAEELQRLVQRTDQPVATIERDVRREIANRIRFAEATGTTYFLTTTCCNIGMRLLQHAPLQELPARGRLAAYLSEVTLQFSPDDVYGWALWRDALEAQGAFEAAELVGWEAIRRYPENRQWRCQLASFLIRRNRPGEAEALLREAADRFPTDDISRCMLAELLIWRTELAEANAIIDAVIASGLAHPHAYSVKARLLYHQTGDGAAIDMLERGLRQYSGDADLIAFRDTILSGGPVRLGSAAYEPLPSKSDAQKFGAWKGKIPQSTVRGGTLRRIAAGLTQKSDPAWAEKALKKVSDLLAEAPNDTYGRYIENEIEQSSYAYGSSIFALAFIDALRRLDQSALNALKANFPANGRLVDVANVALFESDIAAEEVKAWLANAQRGEPRSVEALRGFVTGRLAEADLSEGEAVRTVSAKRLIALLAINDNLPLDLIEAALAPASLLLAA